MKYNHFFANHFRSCRLLVTGHDPHRNREVVVRHIPGEFDVVGVSDGVDCWVAPVTVAPSDLFDRVRRALEAIRTGTFKEADTGTPHLRRRPLTLRSPSETAAPEQPEPRIRRRVVSS